MLGNIKYIHYYETFRGKNGKLHTSVHIDQKKAKDNMKLLGGFIETVEVKAVEGKD